MLPEVRSCDSHYGTMSIEGQNIAIKGVIGECLAFLRGSCDNAEFEALKCKVWADNANNHNLNEDGSIRSRNPFSRMGHIYAQKWCGNIWKNDYY